MKKLIFILIIAISLISCSQNKRVKKYGGSATFELEENQKLINVSWKDSQLWILTKPMNNKDSAETYTYKEKSNNGILEGKFIIVEVKK